jgi:cysteine desulfurase/selenocysteine lyase
MYGRYDVETVRAQFPALAQDVHGNPLVYLDNAATTQKPRSVLDAITHYYESDNANVHRGVHELSQRATEKYEAAREKIRDFIGAASTKEIVFTRGTTEAINLVAQSFVRPILREGDEVLITHLEHHSNIVPWQLVCDATGAVLAVAAIRDDGAVDMDDFRAKLGDRTRFVSVAHVSNALGTVNPVREMVEAAHQVGAAVLVDGAQAVAHTSVDVRALGADFYAASGHKMYGPTGIGFLYGRAEHLGMMPPYQGGGDMIASVTFAKTTYNELPFKFEAGTPNISGAIGLGAAVDFLRGLGIDAVAAHEHDLLQYATKRFRDEVAGGRLIGTAHEKAAVLSYDLPGIHPHDVGTLMDRQGVAIRTGHHCAQPVMDRFGVAATNRASFACYNTRDDVDRFIAATKQVLELFG